MPIILNISLVLLISAFCFAGTAHSQQSTLTEAVDMPPGIQYGDWSDRVDIEIPQGPRGFAPLISIMHSRGSRSNVLGANFELLGSQKITRTSTTGGTPGYSEDSDYYLNGLLLVRDRIVPQGPDSPVNYTKQSDDGSTVQYQPEGNTWVVRQDGWQWSFGKVTDADGNAVVISQQLEGPRAVAPQGGFTSSGQNPEIVYDPVELPGACPRLQGSPSGCSTVTWLLASIRDPFGNLIQYIYDNKPVPEVLQPVYGAANTNDRILASIVYKTVVGDDIGSVIFDYQLRPDIQSSYRSGVRVINAYRLSGIRSYVSNTLYSRYGITYKDVDTTGCDGLPMPQDEAELTSSDTPLQTLVRRINRINVDDTELHRQLRCYDTFHQEVDGSDWTEAETTGDLAAFGANKASALPANINGDGLTDLIVVNRTGDHQVVTSIGDGYRPFRSDDSEYGVASWKALLRTHLPREYLTQDRAWLIFDIDGNGFPDLIHESADDNLAQLWRYEPRDDDFVSQQPQVGDCDLRFAQVGDVDGDGFPDLIRRAHPGTDDCPAREQTKWLRNLGHAPWFRRGDGNANWVNLNVPLADPENVGVVIEPPALNPDWTPEYFAAEQARFTDVNGDGIVDVVYALHRRWQNWQKQLGFVPCPDPAPRNDEEPCQWRPVPRTEFSRIYFGNGFGSFFDSGLAAGFPILNHYMSASEDKYFIGYLGFTDMDRSGSPELLTGNFLGTRVNMHYWRGLAYGFGTATAGSDEAADPYGLDDQSKLELAAYPQEITDCNDDASQPVIADFNGDGFPDLLEFRYDPNGAPGSACFGLDACVTIRYSKPRTSEGRVVASTGSWGGRTELRWSFTAKRNSLWNNPELPVNIEALEEIEGPKGKIGYSYSYGAFAEGRFKGFGLISRENANGGVDTFATALTPVAEGKPLYSARYRNDRSLERLTVNVYGELQPDNRYAIDLREPIFNPRIRECHFEVERNSQDTVSQLINDCYLWNGRIAPSNQELWGVFGLSRYASEGLARTTGEYGWNEVNTAPEKLTFTGESTGQSWDYWSIVVRAGAPQVTWRWPAPSPIPTIPNAETVVNLQVPQINGTGHYTYVTDWAINPGSLQISRIENHRDTSTTEDDVIEQLTWQNVPTPGSRLFTGSYRMSGTTISDRAGTVLSKTTYSNFHGFQEPETITRCGRTTKANDCTVETLDHDEIGQLVSRSTDVPSKTESWTRDRWCGTETYTNPAGETRERKFDETCLLEEETWRGYVHNFTYDGYLRIASMTQNQTGVWLTSLRTDYFHDDVLTRVQDSDFAEPRSATLQRGVLDQFFFDDFGRPTRHVRCPSGTASVQRGDLTTLCTSDDVRVFEWIMYGTDGLPFAKSDPFEPSHEDPVLAVTAFRDGNGRPFVTYLPGNTEAGTPSWVQELTWRAPGRDITQDAIDRVTVKRYGTLQSNVNVAGRPVVRSESDAFGRTIRYVTANSTETEFTYDSRSRLQSMRYAANAPTVRAGGGIDPAASWGRLFRYEPQSRKTISIEPNGLQVEQESDVMGRVTARRTRDRNGQVIGEESWTYAVDGSGKLTSTHVNDLGVSSQLVVDGLGRITYRQDANGVEQRTEYDHLRKSVTVITDDGPYSGTETFVLDAFGSVVETSDASGVSTSTYDGAGRLTSATDTTATTKTFDYLFSGLPAKEWLDGPDGSWLIAERNYDDVYRVISQSVNGVKTQYTYDGLNRQKSVTTGDANTYFGYRMQYVGDSRRVLARKLFASSGQSATTTYDYDDWNRQTSIVNPEPGQSVTFYDVMHRPRIMRDENGIEQEVDYDLIGRISTLRDANGRRWSYSYDDLANWTYRHDSTVSLRGVRRATTVSGEGYTETVWVDSTGRMVARRDADGVGEEYVYDDSFLTDVYRLDLATGNVRTRIHRAYDANGDLQAVNGPAAPQSFPQPFVAENFNGYKIVFERGAGGRIESVDAAGDKTTFTYDPASGLLEAESYLGLTRRFLRPAPSTNPSFGATIVGEELVGRDGSVRTTSFLFDAAGRMTSKSVNADRERERSTWTGFDVYGNPAATVFETGRIGQGLTPEIGYNWKYDLNGRPVSRELSVASTVRGVSSWTWSENGILIKETAPFGKPVSYDYGSPLTANLDRVITSDDNVVQFEVSRRNDLGQPTEFSYPEGLVSFSWSPAGRLVERSARFAAKQTQLNEKRVYDGMGRLELLRRFAPAGQAELAYRYDETGHLVSEALATPQGSSEIEYVLNEAGARLRTVADGRVVSDVDYDPAVDGMLAISVRSIPLQMDSWNAVVRDQRDVQYQRSASGAVRGIRSGRMEIRILRDAEGLPVVTRTPDGKERIVSWRLNEADMPQTVLNPNGTTTTYAQAAGGARTLTVGPNGESSVQVPFFFPDGSLRPVARTLGKGLDAFGATLDSGAKTMGFAFAGMESLPGMPGVHLARHRAYDGETGRFLRPDPAGLLGGLHRTLYGASDPVQFADPLGLWACAAQPGSVPNINLPDFSDRFTIPEVSMIGDVDMQWEITQLEKSMGLDVLDYSDLFAKIDLPTDPNITPSCFKCEPPEGDPGGVPDTDVSTFPIGPIVLQAKSGGGSGKSGGGFFKRLLGKSDRGDKYTWKKRDDFIDPDDSSAEPWGGCDESLGNGGCRHPTTGPGETSEAEKKRTQAPSASGLGGNGGDETVTNFPRGLPIDPGVVIQRAEPDRELQARLFDDPIARGESFRNHRNIVIDATPEADSHLPVEQGAPKRAVLQSTAPARSTQAMSPDEQFWFRLYDYNPMMGSSPKHIILGKLGPDYPWQANIDYGENHYTRGDEHRLPMISVQKLEYVVTETIKGFKYTSKNNLLTGEVTDSFSYAKGGSIGPVKVSGSCAAPAGCSAGGTVSLGPASAGYSTASGFSGSVKAGNSNVSVGGATVNPQKETVEIKIGPDLSAGPVGASGYLSVLFGYSLETAWDHFDNLIQQATGNVPTPPPPPQEYMKE